MQNLDRTRSGNNLIDALHSARRSWWRRSLWDAAVAVVLVAAITVLVLWARAWIVGEPGRILDSSALLRTVLITCSGGLVLWLLAASIRAPSLLDIARKAERVLLQSERFSTSYEVLAAGGASNVVTKSLLADVEERAERLDVGPTGWERSGRRMGPIALGAVLIAAAALVVAVPARRSVAVESLQQPGQSGVQERTAEAATLNSIAELLNLVADQEASDYLNALASSFAGLSEQVGANRVSAADKERQVAELAQHLRAASQEIGGRFAAAVDEAFAAVSSEAAVMPGQPTSESANVPGSLAGGADSASEAAAAAIANLPDNQYYRSFNALMEQFEADPTAVGVRPQRPERTNSQPGAEFYGGVLNAQTDPNAAAPQQPAGARAQGQAGGAAAGAAERSSDAAGDAAGQGGADLGVGSDSFLDLVTQGGEVAALQRSENDEGRFIEMELVPRADESAGSSSSGPVGSVPDFVRSDEATFSSQGIGAQYASVVSRYFTPDSLEALDRP